MKRTFGIVIILSTLFITALFRMQRNFQRTAVGI